MLELHLHSTIRHHDLHEGKVASIYVLFYTGAILLSLTSREEYRRRTFLNKAIRWIFSLREKTSEEDWKYDIISSSSQNFTRVMESVWDGRTRTVAQEVSHRPFTAEARLQSLHNSRVIFGGQISTWTGCSLRTSFFASQSHYTNSLYLYIRLSLKLLYPCNWKCRLMNT